MVDKKIPGVVYMPAADIQRFKDKGVFTEQTLIGAFRETFARGGGRVALSGPSEQTTFGELDRVTDRAAAALWRLGLRPTDRVLFQMRNCKELVYAFFACLKIGVIPVCTLAAHREQEIGYIGRHTEAKAHFVHGDDTRFDLVEFAGIMASEIPSMAHTIVARGTGKAAGTHSFEALVAREDAAAARSLVDSVQHDPQQVALFQLSGGTSGIPKIIPRFSSEYRYAMQSVIEFMQLSESSVAFTANPFMHNAPMSCFWGPTLLAGGEITIADGVSIADIEAALATRQPNWIALARVHLLRLIENGVTQRLSFGNVKAFAVPDNAKQLSAMLGAPCVPMYGMTEGLLAFCAPHDPEETLEFTVGRSTSPHDEIRIVRPGSEEDLPEGEPGELHVPGAGT